MRVRFPSPAPQCLHGCSPISSALMTSSDVLPCPQIEVLVRPTEGARSPIRNVGTPTSTSRCSSSRSWSASASDSGSPFSIVNEISTSKGSRLARSACSRTMSRSSSNARRSLQRRVPHVGDPADERKPDLLAVCTYADRRYHFGRGGADASKIL